jgi:hypothetical protein
MEDKGTTTLRQKALDVITNMRFEAKVAEVERQGTAKKKKVNKEGFLPLPSAEA